MNRLARLAPWLPAVILLSLAASGQIPLPRDLGSYFLPLRAWFAETILAGHFPGVIPEIGAGAAAFANPQIGLLYPPRWLWLLFPATWAMALEMAFHLALLGVGSARLARAFGADHLEAAGLGLAVQTIHPVVAALGMINNIETIAWLPWMLLAAERGSLHWLALATAAAWGAAEPSLLAMALIACLLLRPSRTTLLGLLGGLALMAPQIGAFLTWLATGDRGAGAAERFDLAAGGLLGTDWVGLALPGLLVSANRPWLASVYVGLPLVVAIAFGLGQRRRLAAFALALLALLALTALPLGQRLFELQGLVRYPSRLLLFAIVLLVPLASLATASRRHRRVLATVVLLLIPVAWLLIDTGGGEIVAGWLRTDTIAACAFALCSLVFVATIWRPQASPAWALAAALLPLPTLAPLLVQTLVYPAGNPCELIELETIPETSRLWVYPPHGNPAAASAAPLGQRSLRLGTWPALAEANINDVLPLSHTELGEHLDGILQGPPMAHWWLDAAGIDRILAESRLPGLVPIERRSWGLLQDNPGAWSLAAVHKQLPEAGVSSIPRPAELSFEPDRIEVVASGPGWLSLAVVRDPGWRWELDGQRVEPIDGPGIVALFELSEGEHHLAAVYRPPGWPWTMLLLLAALLLCASSALGPKDAE